MAAESPIPIPGKPKAPSVTKPPAWKPTTPTADADFGEFLDILEGTWKNEKGVYGLHTTPMPSPGTSSEQIPGKFHFVCGDYFEELEFTKVDGAVRNRGGANEQFIAALRYSTQVFSRKLDENKKHPLIHDENGMYLQMKPVFNRPATAETVEEDIGQPELAAGDGSKGPYFVPKYTICRSGTIPHGSTISLLGNVDTAKTNAPASPNSPPPIWNEGSPLSDDPATSRSASWPHGAATWPQGNGPEKRHISISQTMGSSFPFDLDQPAPEFVTTKDWITDDPSSNIAYTQRIIVDPHYPHSVRPDLRLRDTLEEQKNRKQEVKSFAVLELDSHPVADLDQGVGGPKGGVLNVPFVQKFCKASRMTLKMWLEKLDDGEYQLQYEQIVDFEFHFGTDGGVTVWPHIQVNTLKKVNRCRK